MSALGEDTGDGTWIVAWTCRVPVAGGLGQNCKYIDRYEVFTACFLAKAKYERLLAGIEPDGDEKYLWTVSLTAVVESSDYTPVPS